ncbi:MFS domain-containing protein [Aphelenchoides besseyi]|nr:MFS domain-containing protein [Aphelenchoides besseyi]KAI6208563.1 MFS domain-containing protein [Aphelenchoides besseyi]
MRSQQLLVLYGLLTLFNSCFFVLLSSVPYIAKTVGLSDLTLGYWQTVFNVCQLIANPLVGYLVDSIGYKATLSLNFGATALSAVLLYNAENQWAIGLSQLCGILMVAMQTIQTAIAHMTKAGSERTNAFSRIGLSFGVGFVFTPIIAKVATSLAGERGPLIATTLLSVGAIPLIFIFARDLKTHENTEIKEQNIQSTPKSSGWVLIFTDYRLRRLMALKILLLSPSFLIFGTMQIFMMNKFAVDQATNALVQLDIGLSIMFSNTIGITRLRRRFGEEELLSIGAFISIFCFAQFLWIEYLAQIWIGVFCLIFSTTIATSSSDSLISSSVEQEQQGLVLGLSNSAISLFRTTAPTFAIYATERYGYGFLGWIGIGSALAAILLQQISPITSPQRSKSPIETKAE